jgi:uncharacterized protein (TIGR02001 family)
MDNRMKKLALTLLGGGLLFAAASASAELSGNVSIGSDYLYRGISQTNENPTIQGGFDATSESGLYAGVWASNIGFDGFVEIDVYGGYGGKFTDDVEYDIGLLRYEYPDDGASGFASSFNEIYGSVSAAGFKLGFAYSPDFFLESGTSTYLYLDYDIELADDFGVSFHVADQRIKDNAQFGTPDYLEYSIGVSKSIENFDLSLTWHDTDLSRAECFGGSDLCKSRVVFAVGKSL